MSPIYNLINCDLKLEHLWIVYPGKDEYRLRNNVSVTPLKNIARKWIYH